MPESEHELKVQSQRLLVADVFRFRQPYLFYFRLYLILVRKQTGLGHMRMRIALTIDAEITTKKEARDLIALLSRYLELMPDDPGAQASSESDSQSAGQPP